MWEIKVWGGKKFEFEFKREKIIKLGNQGVGR